MGLTVSVLGVIVRSKHLRLAAGCDVTRKQRWQRGESLSQGPEVTSHLNKTNLGLGL